jgi:hypothetical protein
LSDQLSEKAERSAVGSQLTMSTRLPKKPRDKHIFAHPDWLYLNSEGVIHPDLCFITSQAVGHLVMLASVPGGYMCEWHEWEERNGNPVNHSTRGEKFWNWWVRRDEARQDTPELACLSYVNAYHAWLEDHPSVRSDIMSHDNRDASQRLTIPPSSELVSRFSTSDPRSAHQDDYLRGVEQMAALAAHLVRSARNHREAKWDADLAERIAGELRRGRRGSTPHVIDSIMAEIQSARSIRRKRA